MRSLRPIVLALVAVLAAAACGGPSGPSSGGPVTGGHTLQDFLGNWIFSAGQTNQTCSGQTTSTTYPDPDGGVVTVTAKGAASMSVQFESCSVLYDFAADTQVATAQPGQSCSELVVINVNIDRAQLHFNDSGQLQQQESGTLTVLNQQCTYNRNASLTSLLR